MKKITAIACTLACALALTGCASTAKAADTKKADAKPAATATTATTAAVPEHGVIYSGDVAKNSFILADNHTYGKNFQFQGGTGTIFPKDYKAQKGDVIKLHMEATINKAIVLGAGDDNDTANPFALQAVITDTSAAASYWKILCPKWAKWTKAIDAGSSIIWDMEFDLDTNATGKAGSGCANLIIGSSNQQKEAAIFTTTKFTYEITRP